MLTVVFYDRKYHEASRECRKNITNQNKTAGGATVNLKSVLQMWLKLHQKWQNRHRQLGMHTKWWTVKETFTLSSVKYSLSPLQVETWWRIHPHVSFFVPYKFKKELYWGTWNCKSLKNWRKKVFKKRKKAAGVHFCSSQRTVEKEWFQVPIVLLSSYSKTPHWN